CDLAARSVIDGMASQMGDAGFDIGAMEDLPVEELPAEEPAAAEAAPVEPAAEEQQKAAEA
ncbi:MAG: 30S ribosomal protein S2, partial [Pseudomonadota bacterium]